MKKQAKELKPKFKVGDKVYFIVWGPYNSSVILDDIIKNVETLDDGVTMYKSEDWKEWYCEERLFSTLDEATVKRDELLKLKKKISGSRFHVGDKVYEVYCDNRDTDDTANLRFEEYEIKGVCEFKPEDNDIMYLVKYHGAVLYAAEHTLLGSKEEWEEVNDFFDRTLNKYTGKDMNSSDKTMDKKPKFKIGDKAYFLRFKSRNQAEIVLDTVQSIRIYEDAIIYEFKSKAELLKEEKLYYTIEGATEALNRFIESKAEEEYKVGDKVYAVFPKGVFEYEIVALPKNEDEFYECRWGDAKVFTSGDNFFPTKEEAEAFREKLLARREEMKEDDNRERLMALLVAKDFYHAKLQARQNKHHGKNRATVESVLFDGDFDGDLAVWLGNETKRKILDAVVSLLEEEEGYTVKWRGDFFGEMRELVKATYEISW